MSAGNCSGKYPQVRLSTDCFAIPYQQIITISINCKKRDIKECGIGGSFSGIEYPRWRKQERKKIKNGKTKLSYRILPMSFLSLENSEIPELWDLSFICGTTPILLSVKGFYFN